MTDDLEDPTPVGDGLAELRARWEGSAAKAPRPATQPAPTPEVVELAREGRALARERRWRAEVPVDFRPATLDWFGPGDVGGLDVMADIRQWAEAPSRNLVLLGPVGAGKTSLAAAAVRPSCDRGRRFAFRDVAVLLEDLKAEMTLGTTGLLDRLAAVDVLVLDDLLAERVTEWSLAQVGILLNTRWANHLPTVVTSNLAPSRKSKVWDGVSPTLLDTIGERLYSRLVGSGSIVVWVGGDDRRRR